MVEDRKAYFMSEDRDFRFALETAPTCELLIEIYSKLDFLKLKTDKTVIFLKKGNHSAVPDDKPKSVLMKVSFEESIGAHVKGRHEILSQMR